MSVLASNEGIVVDIVSRLGSGHGVEARIQWLVKAEARLVSSGLPPLLLLQTTELQSYTPTLTRTLILTIFDNLASPLTSPLISDNYVCNNLPPLVVD